MSPLCMAAWMAILGTTPALPVYPGAPLVRLGDDTSFGGGVLEVAYFVTADGLREVAEHFLAGWARRGLPCTADGDFDSQATVAAFDTGAGVQLAVVLIRHGPRTLGFSVVRELSGALAAALWPPSPVVTAEGERTERRAGDTTAIEQGLDAELARGGFTAVRRTVRRGTRVLEHARGPERVTTVIATPAGSPPVVWQRRTRVPPAGEEERDAEGE